MRMFTTNGKFLLGKVEMVRFCAVTIVDRRNSIDTVVFHEIDNVEKGRGVNEFYSIRGSFVMATVGVEIVVILPA